MKSIRNSFSFVAISLVAAVVGGAAMGQAGPVVAWGSNTFGDSTVPPNLGLCKAVSSGGDWTLGGYSGHTAVIKLDGTVACWGANAHSQLNIPPSLGPCIKISAGWYHTLVIDMTNHVQSWGGYLYPPVPTDLGVCTEIAAGYLHSLAINASGIVRAWGDNSYAGACNVPQNLGSCKAISASYYWSMALTTSGNVQTWGSNESGQQNVPSDLGTCIGIAAGSSHAAAIQSNGNVKAWGTNNTLGQLNVPDSLGPCVQIAAGVYHTVALQTNGLVVAWGYNASGQSTVPTNLGHCTSIAAGGDHSAAIQVLPSITGVLPISGPSSGNTNITITGTNFEAPATVTIGGAPATNVVVVSDTQITATTPAGFPGPAVVTVNLGSSTAFYYRPSCGSDVDNNGVVDNADLGIVLLDFGNCSESLTTPQEQEPMILQSTEPAKPR
jgi:alpha-tubulin suppressor-like RCC1 family protein